MNSLAKSRLNKNFEKYNFKVRWKKSMRRGQEYEF